MWVVRFEALREGEIDRTTRMRLADQIAKQSPDPFDLPSVIGRRDQASSVGSNDCKTLDASSGICESVMVTVGPPPEPGPIALRVSQPTCINSVRLQSGYRETGPCRFVVLQDHIKNSTCRTSDAPVDQNKTSPA